MLKKIFCFILLLLLISCSEKEKSLEDISSEQDTLAQSGKILRFGTISKHFLNISDQFKPFDNYITNQLSQFGYTTAKTVLASSLEELTDKVNNGEVDVYSGSLYSTIFLSERTDLEPVLKRSIDNETRLSTIIFTKMGSDIKSLSDLLGKVIVFESEHSTSGHFVPKTHLLNEGYKLVRVDKPQSEVDENSIGYCFSDSDENTVAWIVNGYAAAGATDSRSYDVYSGVKNKKLEVLYESNEFLRYVVSINKNLSQEIRAVIANAFITYPEIAAKDSNLKKYYENIEYELLDSTDQIEIQGYLKKYKND